MVQFSVGILTVSDSCSNGDAIDTSGPELRNLVAQHFTNVSRIEYNIISDDLAAIENAMLHFSDELKLNLILTTGGTGFSQRDVTPEATRRIIQREASQLCLAMSLASFKKTKFAALSRAVCGIRNTSLIVNLPGSNKAVVECFDAIRDVIPHAVELIIGEVASVEETHRTVQKNIPMEPNSNRPTKSLHVCPHKTRTVAGDDRNSPFPMIDVDDALKEILDRVHAHQETYATFSSVNIPEFRASIKDGYAVKANGGRGVKRVIGYVSAGDSIFHSDFAHDECLKINTGAPVPDHADSIIQVEDTRVVDSSGGVEKEVEIIIDPVLDLDIRPIGCDLAQGHAIFPSQYFPDIVPYKSLLASVGKTCEQLPHDNVCVTIISTGDELTEPGCPLGIGKIFDSNTTMLRALLEQHGFKNVITTKANDSFDALRDTIAAHSQKSKFIICSGGVSMGDKDFLKDVLNALGYATHFGRVNMKPGKPMTFATNVLENMVFGLPGNPVSAFVTFHLFVLPSLRKFCGYNQHQWSLSKITVELFNSSLELDSRPEYARARIISQNGKLYAEVTDNQMSSRLGSIAGADVLLHLPPSTGDMKSIVAGTELTASILKQHFISCYK